MSINVFTIPKTEVMSVMIQSLCRQPSLIVAVSVDCGICRLWCSVPLIVAFGTVDSGNRFGRFRRSFPSISSVDSGVRFRQSVPSIPLIGSGDWPISSLQDTVECRCRCGSCSAGALRGGLSTSIARDCHVPAQTPQLVAACGF